MQAIGTAYGMFTAILLCFCDCDFVSISSADILSALNHKVDARWNKFGIFLGVDEYTMSAVVKAVNDTGFGALAQELAKEYGIDLF